MNNSIYKDIAKRTNGEVYIGVVGPVRTGKSTFIKKFMETLVLPNIDSAAVRERSLDELPQSAAGKTIMTTEPKFIPEQGVSIELEDGVSLRVRMIDCVGYIVPGALGHTENEQARMVISPWYDDAVPFDVAAETGTRKVINEHSTIGVVVTTDGSISDIPRADYEDAERRVIEELKQINKPFAVLLNCVDPRSPENDALARQLHEKYDVPVLPVNCLDLDEETIRSIISTVTSEFPVREIDFAMPKWISSLKKEHWLKAAVFGAVGDFAHGVVRMSDVPEKLSAVTACEYVRCAARTASDLGTGVVQVSVSLLPDLFYRIIGETTGLQISDEASLMPCIIELAAVKAKYQKIQGALEQVEQTGYGIVMPTLEELRLEEPQMTKQGGKYGVRLRASAPSIHMLRADITTEVNPIVGSEKQSEELVTYMLQEFSEDPIKIWSSNIFGKSLNELVNEGLQNQLYRMPADARMKLQETLERVINDGCNGLVCIIL
ncbi:MAG: stage IV sporulation protein A [Oscillospiraceae bacterium]|nr:stage IV sporulation protein A [Oscillospiraceae bacterium]